MNIIEGIKQFIKGGLEALKDAEPRQAIVINNHLNKEGGYGTNIVPVITPVIQPNVYAPPHYIFPEIELVQFNVIFEPFDYGAFKYLYSEQPVVVFIFDPYEPEVNICLETELGYGINNGQLYPGRYGLLALVVDESLEDIYGIGIADFTIYEGQLPFDLLIPISTDDSIIASLLGNETIVIGNRRSHIYHFSYCPGAYQMAAHNCIIFPSQEAAEDDGYEPCAQCVANEILAYI